MGYGEPRADCVRGLQDLLRVHGAPIDTTGNYLDNTTRYVEQFQAARDLRQDGVLDAATMDALVALPDIGVAGPQTKLALTGAHAPVDRSCTARSRAVYLSRGITRWASPRTTARTATTEHSHLTRPRHWFDDRCRDEGGCGADDEGCPRSAECGDGTGEGTARGGTADQDGGQPRHDAAEQSRFGGLQGGDGRGDEQ